MRIIIVSDAWYPQVNGVVRTLDTTSRHLRAHGHDVHVIGPDRFRTIACPSYPEIRLAIGAGRKLDKLLGELRAEAIHIATEGPLGLAARRYCRRRGLRFTTSFHTRFAEYLRLRVPVPTRWSYAYLRWFHGGAERTMIATESMREELRARGFRNLAQWSRGVDTQLFRPQAKGLLDLPRPIFGYVGRVAVEKNIDDFLRLALPGSKVVIGDGPQLQTLREQHPSVVFVGYRHGEELAAHIAATDVVVFPSRTDTFGLVLIEAMACGVPVAAYPAPGPVDLVQSGENGYIGEDLGDAAIKALTVDPQRCRHHAERYSWQHCTEQFFDNLAPNVVSPA